MSDNVFSLIYLLGLVFAQSLRWYFRRKPNVSTSKEKIALMKISWPERLVLVSIVLGVWAVPLIYIFTDWLEALDYDLAGGMGVLGILLFIFGLWLRFRAQKDLEGNWSPSLVIWDNHTLVTEGIYRWIRHPLYSSLWMWGISQPLLLQNWVAGWVGMVAVALVYFIRRPREEAMMGTHFGEDYQSYKNQTGSIFPKLKKPK
jgi:protein-S-isoprenylcysteine O-methyltransferase Ste14